MADYEADFQQALQPGLLDSVFTWIGQPGYAVKNLLQGEPGAALQNLVQFSSDLTTLGMVTEPLTGYSANPLRNDTLMGLARDYAGIESGGHGITTRDELPTPVDVLNTWGVPTPDPEIEWGKTLALNFVGDVVTDPLNLLMGAGAAAKSLSTGAKLGVSAGENFAGALARAAGETSKGSRALVDVGLDAFLKNRFDTAWLQRAPAAAVEFLKKVQAPDVSDALEESWAKLYPQYLADAAMDPVADAAYQARRAAVEAAQQGPIPPPSVAPPPAAAAAPDPLAYLDRFLADETAWKQRFKIQKAGERLAGDLGVTVDDPYTLAKISGHGAQEDVINAGVRALAREGFVRQPGALYAKIPFVEAVKVLGPEDTARIWEFAKDLSPPHLASRFWHAYGPQGLVEAVDKTAEHAWQGVRTMYDRAFAKVTEALPPQVIGMVSGWRNRLAGDTYTRLLKIANGMEAAGLTRENTETLGRTLTQKLMEFGDVARRMAFADDTSAINALADDASALARLDGGVAARIAEFTPLFEDDFTAKVYANGVQKITNEIASDPALAQWADMVPGILDTYTRHMAEMPRDLRARKIWAEWAEKGTKAAPGRKAWLRTNPFYVPNQADETIAYFLAEHPQPSSRAASDYAGALQKVADDALRDSTVEFTVDNFTRARKYDEQQKLYDAFAKVADEYNVPIPTLRSATSDVLNTDLLSLLMRRAAAHQRTISKADLAHEVAQYVKIPGAAARNEAVDTYLREQFTTLAPRSSWGKILGGGEFVFGLPGREPAPVVGATARTMARLMGVPIKKIGEKEGKAIEVLQFPGINWLYRGLLTSGPAGLNVAFYSRNLASAAFMAALDPDLGPTTALRILKAGFQVPFLSWLSRATGRKWAKSDMAVLVDAIENGWDDVPGMMERTGLSSAEIAAVGARKHPGVGLTYMEITEHARRNVVQANAFRMMDDLGMLGDLETVKRVADEGIVQGLKDVWNGVNPSDYGKAFDVMKVLVRPGARINDHVEASARLTSFLGYLEKGYGLEEATEKVLKRFVDYSYQSNTERWIRDLSLFARYKIGTGPQVIADMIAAPSSTANQAIGSVIRARSQTGILPPEIAGQVAIPYFPEPTNEFGEKQYFTSLGLPYEAAAGLVSAPTPEGFRKEFLGGLNPLLRTAAESVVGVQFWNGQPTAELTKSPALLATAGLAESYTTGSGRVVYTVPPFVNHWLLGAMPWNGFVRLFDKWLDDTGYDERLFNSITGVKVKSVQEHAAVRRIALEYLRQAADRGEVAQITKFFVPQGREVPPEIRQALQAANANNKQRR